MHFYNKKELVIQCSFMCTKSVRIATVYLVIDTPTLFSWSKINFQNCEWFLHLMKSNLRSMATRSSSSSSNTVLLVIILLITFPLWIVLGGICIGIIAGVFGAMIGVIGAIFGVLVSIITLPFRFIFGWGDWGWNNHWPHFHGNVFITLSIIIIIALALKSRGRR